MARPKPTPRPSRAGQVAATSSPDDAAERYRLLVEAVEDYAILGLDPTGHVTSWNAGAEKIKGYRAEEIIGRHYSAFYSPEDLQSGKPDRQLGIAAREGRFEAEGWRIRKDGSRFWASVVITALYDDERRLRGYAKVTRDTTERMEADRAQRKAARELAVANAVLRRQATELVRTAEREREAAQAAEAASRAKSAFLATMSHELRTPLNGLIGMNELLLGTALTDEQSEYAQTMDSCAQSLLMVISDVLDYSRIEAGHLAVQLDEVELRALVEECAQLLAVNAHGKALELLIDLDPAAPSLVGGDAGRIRQVLLNLLGNAIKFTHRGEIVMRLREVPDGARVEIADTGIGIEPRDQERLFGSFAQLDATTTREYGGSGLGLAISKQLVELMGGTIGVESTPGVGSTFWFTLPLAEEAGSRGSDRAEELSGHSVLLVDDNDASRDTLARMLSGAGAEVIGAGDLQSARAHLGAAAERAPDAVIVDWHIEPGDGCGIDEVIADAAAAGIAVILLTAPGRRSQVEMHPAGVREQLSKPITARALVSSVVAILRPAGDPAVEHGARRRIRVLLIDDNPVDQAVTRAMLERQAFDVDAHASAGEALRNDDGGGYDVVLVDAGQGDVEAALRPLRTRTRSGRRVLIIAMTTDAISHVSAGFDASLRKPVQADRLHGLLDIARSARSPRPTPHPASPRPSRSST